MEGILTPATLMTLESESQQSPDHESGRAVSEPPPKAESSRNRPTTPSRSTRNLS